MSMLQYKNEIAQICEELEKLKRLQVQISEETKLQLELLREKNKNLQLQITMINDRMTQDDQTTSSLVERALSNLSEISILKEHARKTEEKLERLGERGIEAFQNRELNMLDKVTNAQAGEDSILAYIVAVLQIPFSSCTYLDLGANRPKEMSNTYFFYSQGAKGVLVEANPKLIPALKFYRNRDLILNRCVDTLSGNMIPFSICNVDGLSAPADMLSEAEFAENPTLKVEETIEIESVSVNDLIENYAGETPVILSIDIEGKDFEILESIDFEKYRPLLVVIEMIEYSVHLTIGQKNSKILNYMQGIGYVEFAFTGINSIFIDPLQVKRI